MRNHFSLAEQRCRHCGQGSLDPAFLAAMNALREICDRPIILSSAYRCPAHNQAVSSTGPAGPHTSGRAADIRCAGENALEVLYAAVLVAAVDAGLLSISDARTWLPLCLVHGFRGIGVAQRGGHGGRFIHLDDLGPDDAAGPRPWIWTY